MRKDKRTSESRKNWSRRAACQGILGFDSPKTEQDKEKYRTICLDCPVLDLCLEYALAYHRDEHGFWAGTTRKERSLIRQELPNSAFSLVDQESHSSFEFAPIRADQVKLPPPRLDLELYSSLVEEL